MGNLNKEMMVMKKYILCLLFGVLSVWGGMNLQAQQLPLSYGMMFRPGLWNPAHKGARDFNKVYIAHQQRHLSVPGWRSISQFLNYNSSPMGKRGIFGWGLMLSNDIEHTENRVGISGATAVSLIKTKKSRLSVGIAAGLINWNSNYDSVRVFDRTDELLANRTNFVELDAGLGLDFEYRDKVWDIEAGAALTQLPGNLASQQLTAITIFPHLLVGGSLLFAPIHNFRIGPMGFYKNTFLSDSTTVKYGTIDVGLKGELDRQGIWFGGAYRLNRSALTLAFGLQVFVSDSANHPTKTALMVDLNAGFSYPMQQASVFGPAIEIGLDLRFGRESKYRRNNDSLRYVNGAFWLSDGNVNTHLERNLAPIGPQGMRGSTYVTDKNVTVTYEFPDGSLQYLGTTPDIKGDTLMELGMEWVGVDGFIEGMVHQVIEEALNPDTVNVLNAETLEPLDGVVFLELSALLKANEAEAFQDAEGMVYEGELGVNNGDEDTLFLSVVYNGADTIVGVPLNHYVSNLELACLKLYSMRKKLQYELDLRYGDEMAFLNEGEKVDAESILGKKIVTIRKPRILPNHPHQDVFQVNQLKIKFTRDVDETVINKAETPEDEDEVLILEDNKRKRRQNPGRFRDNR